MQCSIDKKEIRQKMISKRKELTKDVIEENSEVILESFIDLGFDFKNVMCYLSFGSEVDTTHFISYFKINGFEVSVPVCIESDMFAAKFNDSDLFKVSKLGVLEPENPDYVEKESIDICIVPGVVFDIFGNRVGYGKGYYDKFLNNQNIIKIGVCHDFQLLDKKISVSENDVKMDYIITEKRIIKI